MIDLAIGPAVRMRDLVVVPLYADRKHWHRGEDGLWLQAERCPVAIAVRDASGVRVFGVDGTEHDASAFTDAFPEIASALADDAV